MEIGLIEGTAIHAKDDQIVKALKTTQRKKGGEQLSFFAIKNEAGQIYRRVQVKGIQQLLYFTGRMEELGFVDETLQGARKLKGIDGVFGAGRDMSIEAIKAELLAKFGR